MSILNKLSLFITELSATVFKLEINNNNFHPNNDDEEIKAHGTIKNTKRIV